MPCEIVFKKMAANHGFADITLMKSARVEYTKRRSPPE